MIRKSHRLWALLLIPSLAACGLLSRSPGEKIWRARCAECHGIDASGNTPRYMGREWADLTDDSWRRYGGDDAALESIIREGVFGEMPASADLSRDEMRALLDHLRKLRGEAAK